MLSYVCLYFIFFFLISCITSLLLYKYNFFHHTSLLYLSFISFCSNLYVNGVCGFNLLTANANANANTHTDTYNISMHECVLVRMNVAMKIIFLSINCYMNVTSAYSCCIFELLLLPLCATYAGAWYICVREYVV